MNNWETIKLGKILTSLNNKSIFQNQFPVLTSSRSGLFLQSEYFKKIVASKDNTGYKVIERGQFTYRTMSDDGFFKFNQLKNLSKGLISPAYEVFEVDKNLANPNFIEYLLNSEIIYSQIYFSAQGGTRLALRFASLEKFKLKLPPLAEQNKIVEILSAFQRLIDLIDKKISKEKLIFISLQNNLLKYDSYIDIKRGKLSDYLLDIAGGGTPSKKNPEFWDGDIPWASVKDLISKKIYKTKENITKVGLNSSASRLIPSGVPIMATRMAVGRCALFNIPVAINQDLKALFRNEKFLDKLFLFYFLVSMENELISLGTGSTVKGIRLEDIKDLPINIPSINQQKKIANLLDTQNTKIEILRKKKNKILNLKKSLSDDLLNGRKRVEI